jgi:hypothetical protein
MGDCLMGNLRLYGSTSGYTELAPPAVAPDGVLSLPSGVGTLLTAEGGKVLQVVRATDTTNRTTTSTSFVDASLSVTITPQKSDSAVLLIATYRARAQLTSGTDARLEICITDNSNNAISGAQGVQVGQYGDSTATIYGAVTSIGYATPATTSAVTYKTRFLIANANASANLDNAQQTAQMYAIEVSA